jgi:uncharacterized protein
MKRHLSLATCFLLCLLAAPGLGQNVVTLTLKSEVLGEERSLLVRTPRNYEQSEERYPVLYMTDGAAQFAHTNSTIEFLARNGRMPEMIVVAINNTDRTRDLTPTKAPLQNGANRPATNFPTAGGADKFLTFIQKELIPQIEGKYRTHPYRIFAGHSFGGLLALHAFLNHTKMFNAYLAVSPTMHWDDNLLSRQAEQFFKARKELQRTLFFTLGNEGGDMQRGFERFKGILGKQQPKGFVWDSMLMLDEDHGTVVLRSHYHGLRKIFEHWQLPADAATGAVIGGLRVVDEHYRKLSERYGFTVVPPEALVNQLGYQLMGAGRMDEAIAALKANVERYPRSANVYDSLGEAYEKNGKLEPARVNYERAAQLGEQNKDPNWAVFQDNFKRVSELLKKNAKTAGH